jgi:hypothetical protein
LRLPWSPGQADRRQGLLICVCQLLWDCVSKGQSCRPATGVGAGLAINHSKLLGERHRTSRPVARTVRPASTPNPVPSVSAASPNGVTAHTGNTCVTITGSQFVPGSIVTWNGSARTTVFVKSGQLRVAIPATDLTTAQTANLRVVNPSPGAPPGSVLASIDGRQSKLPERMLDVRQSIEAGLPLGLSSTLHQSSNSTSSRSSSTRRRSARLEALEALFDVLVLI